MVSGVLANAASEGSAELYRSAGDRGAVNGATSEQRGAGAVVSRRSQESIVNVLIKKRFE